MKKKYCLHARARAHNTRTSSSDNSCLRSDFLLPPALSRAFLASLASSSQDLTLFAILACFCRSSSFVLLGLLFPSLLHLFQPYLGLRVLRLFLNLRFGCLLLDLFRLLCRLFLSLLHFFELFLGFCVLRPFLNLRSGFLLLIHLLLSRMNELCFMHT